MTGPADPEQTVASPAPRGSWLRRWPPLRTGSIAVVAGFLLALLSSALEWGRGTYQTDLRGPITISGKGSAVAPAVFWVAFAAAAALGAVFAVSGVPRRVVGALVGVLGVTLGVLGVRGLVHPPVRELRPAGVLDAGATAAVAPAGPLLAVAAGVVLVAAAGLLVTRQMSGGVGQRHERHATRPAVDPELRMWRELDEQRDPTTTAGADVTPDPPPSPAADGPA
jgi:uncharacterized membrane protein (TIGR02234 family)